MLFRLALKVIQYDNLLHSSDIMQAFRWHIKVSDSNFSSHLSFSPETPEMLAASNF